MARGQGSCKLSPARTALRQASQTIVNYVPETTEAEFASAIDAASDAYKTWSQLSIMRRQRVMFE